LLRPIGEVKKMKPGSGPKGKSVITVFPTFDNIAALRRGDLILKLPI
jgi:hypothetical protein